MQHDDHLAFLESLGAGAIRHTGRSFLAHLRGTAELLRSWGAEQDVIAAGMFHSAYGTSTFRSALLARTDRELLARVIGPRAEELVYLFAGEARPASTRGDLPARCEQLARQAGCRTAPASWMAAALIEIECANLIEQGAFDGSGFCKRLRLAMESGHLFVRPAMAQAIGRPVAAAQPVPHRDGDAPLAILSAAAEDRNAILRMVRELVVLSRHGRCWFDPRVAEATFERYVATPECALLVARFGDQPVGFAAAHLQGSLFSRESSAILDALYTRPARARVAGLRLLLAVRAWCRRRGAQELVTATDLAVNGVRAGKFLETIGLPKVGGLHALWLK